MNGRTSSMHVFDILRFTRQVGLLDNERDFVGRRLAGLVFMSEKDR